MPLFSVYGRAARLNGFLFCIAVAGCAAVCGSARAEDAPATSAPEKPAPVPDATPETPPADVVYTADEDLHLRWFFFAGAVNAYPHMKSEKLIREIYDPVMKAIAPGHDRVNTVGQLRDEHILMAPQIGWGVQLSKRFTFTMQGGYVAGTVRTQETNQSVFLFVPWHEDFSIRRGAAYVGAGLDFYPMGGCEQRQYDGFVDHIKGIRPFLGSSVTVTHATYNAKVQIGLKGLPNIGIKLSDAWTIPSVNLHLGFDVPVNERSAISLNAGFNRFADRQYDFGGYAISCTYTYLFR